MCTLPNTHLWAAVSHCHTGRGCWEDVLGKSTILLVGGQDVCMCVQGCWPDHIMPCIMRSADAHACMHGVMLGIV